jgi:hypothetical protein
LFFDIEHNAHVPETNFAIDLPAERIAIKLGHTARLRLFAWLSVIVGALRRAINRFQFSHRVTDCEVGERLTLVLFFLKSLKFFLIFFFVFSFIFLIFIFILGFCFDVGSCKFGAAARFKTRLHVARRQRGP